MIRWRRRLRRYPAPPAAVLVLILALIALRAWDRAGHLARPATEGEQAVVKRAVDGDTLLLADGRRIRLLGVDTPETKHPRLPPEPLGAEASAFTASLAEGKTVRLEYDRERLDKYGRWLAYVYIDGEMLNERLIEEGFSEAETSFPYRSDMKRRFTNAEKRAQLDGRGIWGIKGARHSNAVRESPSPSRERAGVRVQPQDIVPPHSFPDSLSNAPQH